MTWDMVLGRKDDMEHGDGRERLTWDMVLERKDDMGHCVGETG